MYDYVIVGAGAGGCVVASRLSEAPANEVLLIEAGRDMPPGQEPEAIRDTFPSSYGDQQYSWENLIAEVGPDLGDGEPVYARQFTQGKLMGGGSSINGMMAQRGLPTDFDEWESLGATDWGWQGVLPFFNRLETDWDFDGPLHGKHGPIPIRRCPRADWPPFVTAVADEIQERGYQFQPDANGEFGDSLTTVPMNNTPTQRMSSSMAYLDGDVRARPNLTILPETRVDRLVIDAGRVKGVDVSKGAETWTIGARETVLCAGAIHTPTLLLRSGVGPKSQLRAAGVTVKADRPGVGQNLLNHAAVFMAVHLPRGAAQRKDLTTFATAMLRYSSNHPGCPPGDMQLFPSNRTSWHPLGYRTGYLSVLLYKPFSAGSVELKDDPLAPPTVKFRLLSDPRDFDRLVDGVAMVGSVLSSRRVRRAANEAFLPTGGQANALNRPGFLNWLKSVLITWAFDLPFGIRRMLLKDFLVDVVQLANDRAACVRLVRKAAAGVHHVSGTCRMGPKDDPMAVVDPGGRVYGVEGLRVADASIMPTIVSANTHLAVLMIGEKIAQIIKDERPSGR